MLKLLKDKELKAVVGGGGGCCQKRCEVLLPSGNRYRGKRKKGCPPGLIRGVAEA